MTIDLDSLPRYEIDDVRRIAVALATANGSTSTLEVKNALRAEGFYADQAAVRFDMSVLVGNGVLNDDGAANGQYRLFSLPVDDTDDAPNTITVLTADDNTGSTFQNFLNRFRN